MAHVLWLEDRNQKRDSESGAGRQSRCFGAVSGRVSGVARLHQASVIS
jgi:hypothetical protein